MSQSKYKTGTFLASSLAIVNAAVVTPVALSPVTITVFFDLPQRTFSKAVFLLPTVLITSLVTTSVFTITLGCSLACL